MFSDFIDFKDSSLKQKDFVSNMKEVCQRIGNGSYVIPKSNLTKPSSQKGIVDHYRGVVYCDIGKAGTASWFTLYKTIIDREKRERHKWFLKHPYSWNTIRSGGKWM